MTPQSSLDHCVETLIRAPGTLSSRSPADVAELFLAAVSLLCHLKIDQSTLRRSCDDSEASCPQPKEIPAISAVIRNDRLFRALLECLRSTNTDNEHDARQLSNQHVGHQVVGRKRAYSTSSEPPEHANKAIKLSQSPKVPARQFYRPPQQHDSSSLPTFNIQVVAATILYTAFEHIDHWPAHLVKAYAEDSFGPRLWVDDESCRLLVQNLALTHNSDILDDEQLDMLEDANKVANAYRKFSSKNEDDDHESPAQIRRLSISSNNSSQALSANPSNSASNDIMHEDSSSGEEDEELVVTSKSLADDASMKKTSKKEKRETSNDDSFYPLVQRKLNLQQVRQRYFGINMEDAHVAISSSLAGRLDAKVKQNSALLQSLHSFPSIPSVRRIIAGNLERWLQSPGLSGLARSLFSLIVKNMKNSDPPLPEDLKAIDNILSMRLKANQLKGHIENLTEIASRLSSPTVTHRIYHTLLSEVLATLSASTATNSDHLKMISAIHAVVPPSLSAKAFAASLIKLMANPTEINSSRKFRRKKLKELIQLVSSQLGASFDGCKLVESLVGHDAEIDDSRKAEEYEDRAKLIFQCVMLLVPRSLHVDGISRNQQKPVAREYSKAEISLLKEKLMKVKKLLLTWWCNRCGPMCSADVKSSRSKNGTSKVKNEIENIGAGPPDYNSALGGSTDSTSSKWLKLARCVLFMEQSTSRTMMRFMDHETMPEANNTQWQDECHQIDQCNIYGGDVDDEMMWIVLRSAESGLSCDVALSLLEHLFECCSNEKHGSLSLSDAMLVWELYTLVEYNPPEANRKRDQMSTEGNGDAETRKRKSSAILDEEELPQLAFSGMWWRVTIMALVMCGASPGRIGTIMWKEHATIRALIKMTTSMRFRFPTVDCDETDRDAMKQAEQSMRDKEASLAEALFLPPKVEVKKTASEAVSDRAGRASLRQREKRERKLKKQREQEAALAKQEAIKRKKMLKAAQKTIILWDPTGPARKPAREPAELLVAVEKSFGLSKTFHQSVSPDFLLMTVGKTTRDAIERAYDWIIPIISLLPDIIGRLPASASCVLLLRAYGLEGEEQAQFKELAAPLLQHVSDSLEGKFGQASAVRALDLLMADVASPNQDRRKCARRVLFDSFDKIQSLSKDNRSSWMVSVLELEHANAMIGDAIRHMSTAITFERGTVLSQLILSLEKIISFADNHNIDGSWNFTEVLTDFIASRPGVCVETMDRFPEVRSLGITVVHGEFKRCIEESTETKEDDVTIVLCEAGPLGDKVRLPFSLLQSASVLLGLWKEEGNYKSSSSEHDKLPAVAIEELASLLLRPQDSVTDDGDAKGFASAQYVGSSESAVSVESWVMLARSPSDSIAKRAALTAPTNFLPRLMLCSGLPRASLLTMINRLGILGDKADDQGKVFTQLLVPSATSEWDIGRLGHRREVARKLLGRMSAYLRLHGILFSELESIISTTFLEWLSHQCKHTPKPKKKSKQKGKQTLGGSAAIATLSDISDTLPQNDDLQMLDTTFDPSVFRNRKEADAGMVVERENGFKSFPKIIADSISNHQLDHLEHRFSQLLPEFAVMRATEGQYHKNGEDANTCEVAEALLEKFLKDSRQNHVTSTVLKWVPLLTRTSGSESLWTLIFSHHKGVADELWNSLISRCITAWSVDHIAACSKWVLSQCREIEQSELVLKRLVRFFILTSGQPSFCSSSFGTTGRISMPAHQSWGGSEEFIHAAARLSLECLKQDAPSEQILGRNFFPDWLSLLLLLAKRGRNQMKCLSRLVLQEISKCKDIKSREILLGVFLRLYTCNPLEMNLGDPMARTILMEAVKKNGKSWLDWRSPLDDQLVDMLETVASGNGQRLVRPLCDLSKKHPLLMLRKLSLLIHLLENDAMSVEQKSEKRGLIRGQSLTGPLIANVGGSEVKVTVQHWGFCFTEPVWVAMMDIVSAVPAPVLFPCGEKMGLLEFLNVNVRLIFVQSHLRRASKELRIKEKLRDFISTFRKSSESIWKEWTNTMMPLLPSLGEVRNILVCSDLMNQKEVTALFKK